MLIVDTHPHVLASDTAKYPVAPLGGVQSEWSRGFTNTVEEFVARMDEAGVERATLVQASTFHGYDNSYVVDSVTKFPDRFVGIACVDPRAPDAAQTLSYWITDRGLRGVRLFTSGSTMREPTADWFADTDLDPFWQRARDLRIPISAQMRFASLPLLRRVMDRHPEVTFVLDHLSGPPVDDGPPYAAARNLFDLAAYPQLALKFSKNNLESAGKGASTKEAFVNALISSFGPQRLMWGSNYPATRLHSTASYAEIVADARQQLAFLSPTDQEWLFGRAAMMQYWGSVPVAA
jgi:L-fuconolactonase